MSTDLRIRVIKPAERKRRAKAQVEKDQDSARHLEQVREQDAAATVAGWVDELRGQKHVNVDALTAFNSLFEDAT